MPQIFEQNIPIEKKKFVSILKNSFDKDQRKDFEEFAELLEHCCHTHFSNILNNFKANYRPFMRNEHSSNSFDDSLEHLYAANLITQIKKFLTQKQYRELSEYDIIDILSLSHQEKFQFQFPMERYQEFLVFFHGEKLKERTCRKWHTLFLKKHSIRMHYYKKIIVLFRSFRLMLKKKEFQGMRREQSTGNTRNIATPQPIHLKLFQNIPRKNLPIIFPDIHITAPSSKKIFWSILSLLTIGLVLSGFFFCPTPWYGLSGIPSLLVILYSLSKYKKIKRQYIQDFLSSFYYDSIATDHDVLGHLLEGLEENLFKQLLVVFHAFWHKEFSVSPMRNVPLLHSYLSDFFLKYCGGKAQMELENILVECSTLWTENNALPPFIAEKSQKRGFIAANAFPGDKSIDIKSAYPEFIMPRAGIVELHSEKGIEKKPFFRNPYLLQIINPHGLQFSHNAGTSIRWIIDDPFQCNLAEDCSVGSNYLPIQQDQCHCLPLHGKGKIIGEEEFSFRYYREGNRLFLIAGLRYPHTPSKSRPVLVHPILPHFLTLSALSEGMNEIPVPGKSNFTEHGFIRIISKNKILFSTEYKLQKTVKGTVLALTDSIPCHYEPGAKISLSPPVTKFSGQVAKGTFLIPVEETRHFKKRGVVILSPGQEQEERCAFYREALSIKLDSPLLFSHKKGSFVKIEQDLKSKLLYQIKKGAQVITIHGFGIELSEGSIALVTEHGQQEVRHFTLQKKYLYLGAPTQYSHEKEEEVWEACFESQLRHEVFQGQHLIPVDNASSFPLTGTLEIDFDKENGVKEVFPYRRHPSSDILSLSACMKQDFKKGAQVLITAVDVSAKAQLNYGDKTVDTDFSCVPDFPFSGSLLIDPGTPSEETIEFDRSPDRLYLKSALDYEYNDVCEADFSQYHHLTLTEPLEKNSKHIMLDYGYLLPSRGYLFITEKEKTDMIWYRKLPERIIFESPCRYPHNLGSSVYFPGVTDNVFLAEPINKGEQQIKIINAQELPLKGRIKIKGLFRSIWREFVREGDILFLRNAMPCNFSTRAKVTLPEVFLDSHLSPGMDYAEISDCSALPQSGEMVLEKATRNRIYKRKNRKEERITFRYNKDILWLETPLEKNYNTGAVVFARELVNKGAGELEIKNIAETKEIFNDWLKNQLKIV